MRTVVTRDQIVRGVQKLGVVPGDILMVHSSLKSFGRDAGQHLEVPTLRGRVDGGAEAVIDAFLHVIGSTGTLVMPTMGKDRGDAFDPVRTPASTGLIPETFRRRPGTVRSLHPTHSVAALGPKAEWITEGHGKTTALLGSPKSAVGRAGPYGKLVDLDAAYTFAGTGLGPCTLFHAFEEWMGLPYLQYEGYVLHHKDAETGEQKVFRGSKGLSGHRGFYVKKQPSRVEVALREAGLVAESKVGNATLAMFRARPAAELVLRLLRTDTALLLCESEDCEYCSQARGSMAGWTPSADPVEIMKPMTS